MLIWSADFLEDHDKIVAAELLISLEDQAQAFAVHGDFGIDPFAYTYD